VIDAPVARGDSAFPVLIYNHGGAWTRWSATFAAEWLASHGYVVASVEHFGFNQTARFPDGTEFKPDTLVFPKETGDGKADALASWTYLNDPIFKIWVADSRFAIDRLEDLNREPGPLRGRLDLERIGAFGWSFGGATAVQLTRDDPRVKAAVDHDGQLFGDVRELGTSRPVMQLSHGVDDALAYPEKDRPAVRELLALVASWDSTAREQSSGDWYQVVIAGTDHGDFSDLVLFYQRDETMLDPRRAHEVINGYTLAYFDKYLRGRESAMLTPGAKAYPEATFRAWIRSRPDSGTVADTSGGRGPGND
jgi:dienelactone hydrolase